MATIGTFTSTENGFTGSIRTLALNVKARIARVENPSDKGPQFRVYAGSVELGAAWQKTSEQGRDYLSVKLDDPSFPAPIYATLAEVEGEEGQASSEAKALDKAALKAEAKALGLEFDGRMPAAELAELIAAKKAEQQ